MTATAKIEIDGKAVEVPVGTMVIEAANRLGIFVPHFCYHSKLSIAANCRMCLVQVEKAPKPLPACATPVADGLKVWTGSDVAKQAQRGVMEFLLINHPLDCPICDQGGECQLQDLAVGYGGSSSTYVEPKRVVAAKPMGPLISAEEMTRCIHCTRCVRFGQEIAGVMELGMIGRGEHAEIVSFVGSAVSSELSGNMIDICPVGALTSKPFRYTARTWELGRRKSVSPHDGLGANLVVQVHKDRVMRVVPFENEALNECWLSDKDRFSYEGLNSPDRLVKPMIRSGGEWLEVDWDKALAFVAAGLKKSRGPGLGALVSPHATLEEMYLAQKLVRGLGSENVDFRLRQSDFAADGKLKGAPWLGMKVQEIGALDRVLVVGSFLRKDHPLIANRLRQAAKRGQQVNTIHVADDELAIRVANKAVVRPGELPAALGQVVRALAEEKGVAVPAGVAGLVVGDAARAIARSLASGKDVGIFLGNAAQQHPRASQLHAAAQEAAKLAGARFGFLGEAANSVGGYVARCTPGANGMNAAAMLAQPRSAYLLVNVEPELDTYHPGQALAAMAGGFAVALTPYLGAAADYADALLPIAPFTETPGTFVNTEGRVQGFNAVVKPLGESRPAWKVLRVLGNLLGLRGFDHDRSEQIRDEACPGGDASALLSNAVEGIQLAPAAVPAAIERVADVPIYFADPVVRRAGSLQQTADAAPPRAFANGALLRNLGVTPGSRVRVKQDGGEALVNIERDDRLPDGVVRLAAAHPSTAALGGMFNAITVERAA
ncbi:MAG TPA: NADH-quinone oxidoreductase subunit NuoG [Burkholderiales bacterium]|nr:NADH-quinone oxidoreductase subunit NuoG [Burkholderiales bacterium]